MAIACPKSVRGVALRVTLLDECNVPVDTATVFDSQIATKGFMSLNLSPDIENGDTFRTKLASGELCINDNEDWDKLVGLSVTLMLCDLAPHLNELLTGAAMLVDGSSNVVGSVLPDSNYGGTGPNSVVLELWSENSNKTACSTGTDLPYIRWILPRVFKWQVSGDRNFANSPLEWELSGYAESNPNFAAPVSPDPDLSAGNISAIKAGGPLAWIATDTLPTLVACDYTNPTP